MRTHVDDVVRTSRVHGATECRGGRTQPQFKRICHAMENYSRPQTDEIFSSDGRIFCMAVSHAHAARLKLVRFGRGCEWQRSCARDDQPWYCSIFQVTP